MLLLTFGLKGRRVPGKFLKQGLHSKYGAKVLGTVNCRLTGLDAVLRHYRILAGPYVSWMYLRINCFLWASNIHVSISCCWRALQSRVEIRHVHAKAITTTIYSMHILSCLALATTS
jgi:hypothetical protein